MASPVPDAEKSKAVEEALRRHELTGLLEDLARENILPLIFKGTALAYQIYAEPHLRPRLDTDLLILPKDSVRFAEIAAKHGFQSDLDSGGELIRQQYVMSKTDEFRLLHVLDVHLKISNPSVFAELLSYQELFKDSVLLPKLSPAARGPSEKHALLIACMHRVAHHFNSENPVWLQDIHLLVHHRPAGWLKEFYELAKKKGLLKVCIEGLKRSQQKWGTVILYSLDDAHLKDLPEDTARYLEVKPQLASRIWADLKSLPSWPKRLQLLREHLFPSGEYMRQRYAGVRRWNLPFFYLFRLVWGSLKSLRRFGP